MNAKQMNIKTIEIREEFCDNYWHGRLKHAVKFTMLVFLP